jgi:hypothetical protein
MSRRGVVLGVVVVVLGIGVALLQGTDVGALFQAERAQEPDGFVGQLAGRVSDVDAEARVLRVSDGPFALGSSTVVVDPAAEVRIDGKIGVLEEVRDGSRLRVCYEVRGTRRFARLLELPPSEVPCARAASTVPDDPPVSTSTPSSAPVSATAPATTSPPPDTPTQPPVTTPAAPARSLVNPSPSAPAPPRASAPPPAAASVTDAKREAAPAEHVVRPGPRPRRSDASTPPVSRPPAGERPATSPPPPTTREPSRQSISGGEDYGAVIDQVLRR